MAFDEAQAADVLFAAAQAGVLSPDRTSAFDGYTDDDTADGLRLQLAVLDRWRRAGERLGGWKIGLTSRAARDSMGPGFRPFGYLLESRMFGTGSTIPRSRIGQCTIEPEIAMRMGSSLSGRGVTPAEARRAVASLAPAFEINQRRLPPGLPRPIRIGDNLTQWGTVFGSERLPTVEVSSLQVAMYHDDVLVASGMAGPTVSDDPFVSLARVCSVLADHGLALEAGQQLITGALLPPAAVERGTWRARFGELGEVTVTFA